jgi:VCBS repeat-containing protein
MGLICRRKLELESLESRQMLATTVLEQEDNGNTSRANAFQLDTDGIAQLVGSLSVSDDRDYYRFIPGGDSTNRLFFNVTSPTGIRPDFEIQDAAGNTIAETDPDHGINSGSVVVTLGQVYFARLDGSTGYQVHLNLPPVTHAVADTATAAEEGDAISIHVLANDVGMYLGDDVALVSVDGTGLHGRVSVDAQGGSIVYNPGIIPGLEAGGTAIETFRYTMSYAGGTREATAVVSVTVTGANHQPTAQNDVWTASEDSGVTIIPVLNNDSDIDIGDTKRVISVQASGIAGIVQVASGGTGVLFYPNNAYQSMMTGQIRQETLTYTMADRAGAVSTATLVIDVTGANDAPTAVSNSATVSEDATSVFLDVLPDDRDVDIGDSQTVIGVDGSATPGGYDFVCVCSGGACVPYWIPGMPAIRGTINIAPNGTGVMYSPGNAFQYLTAGQSAIEVFRYTIRDSEGLLSTANVVVTVQGRNERVLPGPVLASPAPEDDNSTMNRGTHSTLGTTHFAIDSYFASTESSRVLEDHLSNASGSFMASVGKGTAQFGTLRAAHAWHGSDFSTEEMFPRGDRRTIVTRTLGRESSLARMEDALR